MLTKTRWTVSLAVLVTITVMTGGCSNATKSDVVESKSTEKTETTDGEDGGKHDG